MGSPVHSEEVKNEVASEDAATLTEVKADHILALYAKSEELVRIEPDGTVVISKEGADKEAARIFYESLQIQGKNVI